MKPRVNERLKNWSCNDGYIPLQDPPPSCRCKIRPSWHEQLKLEKISQLVSTDCRKTKPKKFMTANQKHYKQSNIPFKTRCELIHVAGTKRGEIRVKKVLQLVLHVL